MKILYAAYFTNKNGTVGLAITESDIGKHRRKLRISSVIGKDRKYDDCEIASWGSTIPTEEVENILRILKNANSRISVQRMR